MEEDDTIMEEAHDDEEGEISQVCGKVQPEHAAHTRYHRSRSDVCLERLHAAARLDV